MIKKLSALLFALFMTFSVAGMSQASAGAPDQYSTDTQCPSMEERSVIYQQDINWINSAGSCYTIAGYDSDNEAWMGYHIETTQPISGTDSYTVYLQRWADWNGDGNSEWGDVAHRGHTINANFTNYSDHTFYFWREYSGVIRGGHYYRLRFYNPDAASVWATTEFGIVVPQP